MASLEFIYVPSTTSTKSPDHVQVGRRNALKMRPGIPTFHQVPPQPDRTPIRTTSIHTMSPNSKILKTSRTKLHNYTRTFSKLPNSRLALSRQNSNDSDSDSDSSVSNGGSIEITSGPTRTHSTLLDTISTTHGPRLAHKDVFLCKGAVDVAKLLVLTRRTLYTAATECGGNVLLDEQWCCKISQPKFRRQNRFRVKIQYSATVARSYWPDPQRPVEINAAKGIDGLMTILHRKE